MWWVTLRGVSQAGMRRWMMCWLAVSRVRCQLCAGVLLGITGCKGVPTCCQVEREYGKESQEQHVVLDSR